MQLGMSHPPHVIFRQWKRHEAAVARRRDVSVACALLMGLVGAGIIFVSFGTLAQEPSGPQGTVQQVWTGPGVDFSGTPSHDGRYLTFVDWTTGDLAIRNLMTGENRRLTNKGSWAESDEFAEFSVISPDGRQVAYAWFNGQFYDLRLVGTDGSGQRLLYRDRQVDYIKPGGWSRDGKYVSASLSLADKTNRIALVSVVDGSLRVLKVVDSRQPHVGPFSPDGRYLVFDFPRKQDSTEHDVFLLDLDGGAESVLVEHPANHQVLGWSPDGRGVLFTSDRTGPPGIWIISVANGEPKGVPELVKSGLEGIVPLGLTRTGALYYGLFTGIRDAFVAQVDWASGKVVSPPQPVSERFVGHNRMPTWSPNGKHFVYLSDRGSRLARQSFPILVIRSLETGQERQLSPKLAFEPPWSPLCLSVDGGFVFAAARNEKGDAGLYRIDTQTGEVSPILLSESGTTALMPTVSPDGNSILFLREGFADKSSSIVMREIETGREKELYRALRPSFISNFVLSPDGETLAFRWANQDYDVLDILKVVPLAGGEPRDLLRAQVPKNHNISGLAGLAWTRDKKYLVFGRWTGHPEAEQPVKLLRISAKGGEAEELGLVMHRLWGLRMHPDGHQIGFTAGDRKPEVWLLENFLPKPSK